jgi:hypothetical protein
MPADATTTRPGANELPKLTPYTPLRALPGVGP